MTPSTPMGCLGLNSIIDTKAYFAVLFLSITWAQTAPATDGVELAVCEKALQRLIFKLETSGEFDDKNLLTELPHQDTEYSLCTFSTGTMNHPDSITYSVYRHSDNVTIFVHRVRANMSTILLYGPFYSAYRK